MSDNPSPSNNSVNVEPPEVLSTTTTTTTRIEGLSSLPSMPVPSSASDPTVTTLDPPAADPPPTADDMDGSPASIDPSTLGDVASALSDPVSNPAPDPLAGAPKPKNRTAYFIFMHEKREEAKTKLLAAGNEKPSVGEVSKEVSENGM